VTGSDAPLVILESAPVGSFSDGSAARQYAGELQCLPVLVESHPALSILTEWQGIPFFIPPEKRDLRAATLRGYLHEGVQGFASPGGPWRFPGGVKYAQRWVYKARQKL